MLHSTIKYLFISFFMLLAATNLAMAQRDNRYKVSAVYLNASKASLHSLADHSETVDFPVCLDHLDVTLPIVFQIGKLGNTQEDFLAYRKQLSDMMDACSAHGNAKFIAPSQETLDSIRQACSALDTLSLRSDRQLTIRTINTIIHLIKNAKENHSQTLLSVHEGTHTFPPSSNSESTNGQSIKEDLPTEMDDQSIQNTTDIYVMPSEDDETPPDVLIINEKELAALRDQLQQTNQTEAYYNDFTNHTSTNSEQLDPTTTGIRQPIQGITYINGAQFTQFIQLLSKNAQPITATGLLVGYAYIYFNYAVSVTSPLGITAAMTAFITYYRNYLQVNRTFASTIR